MDQHKEPYLAFFALQDSINTKMVRGAIIAVPERTRTKPVFALANIALQGSKEAI